MVAAFVILNQPVQPHPAAEDLDDEEGPPARFQPQWQGGPPPEPDEEADDPE
jgi:hypothetical protein